MPTSEEIRVEPMTTPEFIRSVAMPLFRGGRDNKKVKPEMIALARRFVSAPEGIDVEAILCTMEQSYYNDIRDSQANGRGYTNAHAVRTMEKDAGGPD